MSKRILLISIIVIMLASIAAISVAYAWFVTGATFNNIVVRSGVVEAEASLYYYEDFDHDGTLDIVGGEYVITPITTANIVDIKAGDVYYYRIDVLNTGSISADLRVYFEGMPQSAKEVLSIESHVVDGNDNEVAGAGVARQSLTVSNDIAIVSGLSGTRDLADPPEKQLSIFFKIRFERLEDLKLLLPSIFLGAEDLNGYQNIDLDSIKIVVNLTQQTGE